MKTVAALILPGLVLAGCQLVEAPKPPPPPPASGIGFIAPCNMPLGALVATGEGDKRHYSFVLNDKDVGGCSDDSLSRRNAPYWERAELRQQGQIELSEPQVIKFDARFRHGFSGRQESFFRIENGNPACESEPGLVLRWHRGELELSLLQESGLLKPKRYPERQVDRHRSWSTWQVHLDRKPDNGIAVNILADGRKIGRGHVAHFSKCATPHVRFGIYRPGNTWDGTNTSVVEFRKFSLKPLNPKPPAKAPKIIMRRKTVTSPKS